MKTGNIQSHNAMSEQTGQLDAKGLDLVGDDIDIKGRDVAVAKDQASRI